jgi:hypothetical protein
VVLGNLEIDFVSFLGEIFLLAGWIIVKIIAKISKKDVRYHNRSKGDAVNL